MRNDYILPFNQWTGLRVPSHMTVRTLDQIVSEAINGVDGGTWSPKSPITIGGMGMNMTSNARFTGGVRTGKRIAKEGGIILADQNWPVFDAPRSRQVVFPIRDVSDTRDYHISGAYDDSVPGSYRLVDNGSTTIVVPLDSKRVPAGSVLTTATLTFRVGEKPELVPVNRPYFLLLGVNAQGDTARFVGHIDTWAPTTLYQTNQVVVPTPISTRAFQATNDGTSSGTQPPAFLTANPGDLIPDGFVTWSCFSLSNPFIHAFLYAALPPASSANDYYRRGGPQQIVMSNININSTITDSQDFSYFLFIDDRSNTKNVYHSLKLEFSGINSLKPVI